MEKVQDKLKELDRSYLKKTLLFNKLCENYQNTSEDILLNRQVTVDKLCLCLGRMITYQILNMQELDASEKAVQMFKEQIQLHKSVSGQAFPHEKRQLSENFDILKKRLNALLEKQEELATILRQDDDLNFFYDLERNQLKSEMILVNKQREQYKSLLLSHGARAEEEWSVENKKAKKRTKFRKWLTKMLLCCRPVDAPANVKKVSKARKRLVQGEDSKVNVVKRTSKAKRKPAQGKDLDEHLVKKSKMDELKEEADIQCYLCPKPGLTNHDQYLQHISNSLQVELDSATGSYERQVNELMDDDLGLSSIRQEAERLRLQQLNVEQEIAAQQRESQQLSAEVSIKLPSPYQPPKPSFSPPGPPPPRPEKPPQVKVVVPRSPEQVLRVVDKFVRVIYEARAQGLDMGTLVFNPDSLEVPADYTGEEREAFLRYHSMLFSVTLERVVSIYKWETVEQNPPWMEQLPLTKMRFLIPRTVEALVERVQKDVGFDLNVVKKNLLLRWAGKKRDRVDEILVKELQEEEFIWTDFSQDEVLVKEQMADIILESLIEDTTQVLSEICSK